MSKNNKYEIYFKGQILSVSKELYDYYKKSERKIKYMEEDIKFENVKVSQKEKKVVIIPSREDSLDRLCENGFQFKADIEAVEDYITKKVSLDKALEKLSAQEYEIIYQLYYIGKTEQQLADRLGTTQQNISRIKKAVLCKLHELIKF